MAKRVEILRAQIHPTNPSGWINTTAKGAFGRAKVFAPTWKMVADYKYKSWPESEYTKAYLRILDKVSPADWKWLAEQAIKGEVVVTCFCRNDWFCHTFLLIDYAVKRHPELFR